MASVYDSRTNSLLRMPSNASSTVASMRSWKNCMSSAQCSSASRKIRLKNASASVHVVVQLEKGHLRLDHPELGQMPRRVRVFRAERRAKGVDLAQRAGENFRLQLAADRQISGRAEEVVAEVDFAILARRLGQVERGDLEHLAAPLRNRWR